MFSGCKSLTTAPALSATELANYCYQGMFNGCTSLTVAPALPATTLKDLCYRSMFQDCTSLTSAPVLPAETLASNCYYYMFSGCTKLNYIKVYFATWHENATTNWLEEVAATGTFVCVYTLSQDMRIDASHIPDGWDVENFTTTSS